MKKITLMIAIAIISLNATAQTKTAGKIFQEGKNKDKSYVLGDDKAMNVVLESIKAYNTNDAEKDLSFSSKDRAEKTRDFTIKYHKAMKSLDQKPYLSFPLKVQGAEDNLVFTLSEENRVYNNGSKEKIYVFEVNTVNKDLKISNFKQFVARPKENEFGLETGGKVYLKDTTSTFTLSNRGEVAAIEKMGIAFNKMDAVGVSSVFADSITWSHADGVTVRVKTIDFWTAHFNGTKSVEWKINGILPYKMTDTDPESGILVNAIMKEEFKNGTSFEKRQVLIYTYNLEGKISQVTNFMKDLNPVAKASK
ncbi:MAG: hypothetical protein WCJ68_02700 [Chitinophagia bacterium]|jgi:hypothetical protein